MSVALWSGSLLAWERELAGLKARVGRIFGRREPRETGADFLDGLLSGVERKTGWLKAEQSGAERPYRMQSLLGRRRWDADRLRDEVRDYDVESLGEEDGVLIVDETGFVKKGAHSAGVARQYSGTAGRIGNCQVWVFLAYASRYGQAPIDRRLFLPELLTARMFHDVVRYDGESRAWFRQAAVQTSAEVREVGRSTVDLKPTSEADDFGPLRGDGPRGMGKLGDPTVLSGWPAAWPKRAG